MAALGEDTNVLVSLCKKRLRVAADAWDREIRARIVEPLLPEFVPCFRQAARLTSEADLTARLAALESQRRADDARSSSFSAHPAPACNKPRNAAADPVAERGCESATGGLDWRDTPGSLKLLSLVERHRDFVASAVACYDDDDRARTAFTPILKKIAASSAALTGEVQQALFPDGDPPLRVEPEKGPHPHEEQSQPPPRGLAFEAEPGQTPANASFEAVRLQLLASVADLRKERETTAALRGIVEKRDEDSREQKRALLREVCHLKHLLSVKDETRQLGHARRDSAGSSSVTAATLPPGLIADITRVVNELWTEAASKTQDLFSGQLSRLSGSLRRALDGSPSKQPRLPAAAEACLHELSRELLSRPPCTPGSKGAARPGKPAQRASKREQKVRPDDAPAPLLAAGAARPQCAGCSQKGHLRKHAARQELKACRPPSDLEDEIHQEANLQQASEDASPASQDTLSRMARQASHFGGVLKNLAKLLQVKRHRAANAAGALKLVQSSLQWFDAECSPLLGPHACGRTPGGPPPAHRHPLVCAIVPTVLPLRPASGAGRDSDSASTASAAGSDREGAEDAVVLENCLLAPHDGAAPPPAAKPGEANTPPGTRNRGGGTPGAEPRRSSLQAQGLASHLRVSFQLDGACDADGQGVGASEAPLGTGDITLGFQAASPENKAAASELAEAAEPPRRGSSAGAKVGAGSGKLSSKGPVASGTPCAVLRAKKADDGGCRADGEEQRPPSYSQRLHKYRSYRLKGGRSFAGPWGNRVSSQADISCSSDCFTTSAPLANEPQRWRCALGYLSTDASAAQPRLVQAA
ncbi:hypothetical protein DIPPA_07035 [Diplonema papillatum]|nr:hypothetical protein DIPPA_07035 [Diplonema papillatum]